MSLFSTITHDGSFAAGEFRPKRVALVSLAVVVAAVITLSIALRPNVDSPDLGANAGALTAAEFIELNTVSLIGLEPVNVVSIDDGFMYWNVQALEFARPGVAAAEVDREPDPFLYWNTDSIDYAVSHHVETSEGPR